MATAITSDDEIVTTYQFVNVVVLRVQKWPMRGRHLTVSLGTERRGVNRHSYNLFSATRQSVKRVVSLVQFTSPALSVST
jgi:hypothetical protein